MVSTLVLPEDNWSYMITAMEYDELDVYSSGVVPFFLGVSHSLIHIHNEVAYNNTCFFCLRIVADCHLVSANQSLVNIAMWS